jgi:hypothetical protein
VQGQNILNRAALLLPARIREGFCDGPLRKIEQVGKTERHEIAGKTSEISDALIKKRFHLPWDIDRVPYRFHKQSLSRPIAFVKKLRAPSSSNKSDLHKHVIPHQTLSLCKTQFPNLNYSSSHQTHGSHFVGEAASFGASEATIFSKRRSPRSGSQKGSSFRAP